MAKVITTNVSHSQLAVFVSTLQDPFNNWTDRHVEQGFSWRPGSVSFRTLEEAGPHSIDIDVVEHAGQIHPDAVRVVEVPFEIPAGCFVDIGSIAETMPLSLPTGSFLLRCEFLRVSDALGNHVRLTFANKDTPRFAIIRADSELTADGDLLTTAQPASTA